MIIHMHNDVIIYISNSDEFDNANHSGDDG